MTKLALSLSAGSNNTTLIRRAEQAANRLKLEQESLVNSLRRTLASKESELETCLDLGPEETTSMRPTANTFDPATVVKKVHDLEVELINLRVELDIAEKTLVRFSEEAPATAGV